MPIYRLSRQLAGGAPVNPANAERFSDNQDQRQTVWELGESDRHRQHHRDWNNHTADKPRVDSPLPRVSSRTHINGLLVRSLFYSLHNPINLHPDTTVLYSHTYVSCNRPGLFILHVFQQIMNLLPNLLIVDLSICSYIYLYMFVYSRNYIYKFSFTVFITAY